MILSGVYYCFHNDNGRYYKETRIKRSDHEVFPNNVACIANEGGIWLAFTEMYEIVTRCDDKETLFDRLGELQPGVIIREVWRY